MCTSCNRCSSNGRCQLYCSVMYAVRIVSARRLLYGKHPWQDPGYIAIGRIETERRIRGEMPRGQCREFGASSLSRKSCYIDRENIFRDQGLSYNLICVQEMLPRWISCGNADIADAISCHPPSSSIYHVHLSTSPVCPSLVRGVGPTV